MDRQIKKSTYKKYRKFIVGGLLLLFLMISVYLMSGIGGKYKVKASRLRTAEVKHTTFDDVIAVQGSVEPVRSFFLDAVEGGSVQEIFVEAGMMVKEGQPLLRLSNTQLMLDFMNRETQIVEQINNLRNTRLQMELNERNIREQVLNIVYEREGMERQFNIDTGLYASDVIARQEFEDSKARYEYLKLKEKLLLSTFEKDEAYRKLQLNRIDQSIEMMERNLEAIRGNLENLTVKAPISGQLTSFDAEIGESKMKGENLGRIDVLEAYIVKAEIDEHYLSRVMTGQKATLKMGNKLINLNLVKVFPEVQNNKFTVEFNFEEGTPSNIRRGQTFSLRLALNNSVEATVIPVGAYYSSSGGKWAYVISSDGSEAHKREIKTGRQNPDYVEVLSGLDPGEEIITSSYDTYSSYNIIKIEND